MHDKLVASATAMLVVSALLTSCLPDYFPRRKLKVNLSGADMAGNWKLTTSSAKILTLVYHVSIKPNESAIEFFADGRCELRDFIGEDEDVHSGAATWKIEQDSLEPKASVLHISYRTPERPVTFSLSFTRRRGKIILWQYHGDPDSREYVEYERVLPNA